MFDCVLFQSAVTPNIYKRRLDFPYKKRTKNSVQNIKNPNLTRTGIFGNFRINLGLTDWFFSVPPSERCKLSVIFRINSVSPSQSTRPVRNDSAASVSDLVLPTQVAYDLGLRRFYIKINRFDETHDFHVETFSIRGHIN